MFCLSAAPAAALTKPALGGHADAAPAVPRDTGGAVQAPSGDDKAAPEAGSKTVSLSGLIGAPGGSNLITFSRFTNGNIVVVLDDTSLTGHAGLFDSRYYVSIYSYAMVSANVSPKNGVQREQCIKYRTYGRAYGLSVPGEGNHGAAARDWAYRQMGKPYSVLGAKTDLSSFYCSKLVWGAWRYTSGRDLDGDGGYWVWPVDLINSPYTYLFGYWG